MNLFPPLMRAPIAGSTKVSMIGPVAVAVLTEDEALRRVNALIDEDGERIVAFCNAHTVNLARGHAGLGDVLDRSLVLNDGAGLDIARRWLEGKPFPANLAGTDFVTILLRDRQKPLMLYLLGSRPGVCAASAVGLSAIAPQHQVVGIQDGYFSAEQEDAVLADIVRCQPDIVLVGMGQPRQEIWASRYAMRTGALVICVGAYLDFVAGEFPRAPAFLRAIRVEWLYRLMLEPRRLFRRYVIGNPTFLLAILRDRYRTRSR